MRENKQGRGEEAKQRETSRAERDKQSRERQAYQREQAEQRETSRAQRDKHTRETGETSRAERLQQLLTKHDMRVRAWPHLHSLTFHREYFSARIMTSCQQAVKK